jgi:hypothetical protein
MSEFLALLAFSNLALGIAGVTVTVLVVVGLVLMTPHNLLETRYTGGDPRDSWPEHDVLPVEEPVAAKVHV